MSSRRRPPAGSTLVLALLAIGVAYAGLAGAIQTHIRDVDPPLVNRWPDMRIDVNVADEAELTLLPGIGPRLAERIVLDREINGRYRTLDELTRVTWIGPVTVQRLEHLALVEPEQAMHSLAD